MNNVILQHYHFSIPIFIFSFAAACHLSHAKITQVPISYCNEVLNGSAFELVADAANRESILHHELYDVAYKLRVPRDRCKISRNHSLTIGFERIAKVSGILIDETTFGTKHLHSIKVSLRRGATSFQCSHSGNIVELSYGKFANFSCLLDNHAYHFSSGVAANGIEISSVKSDISVNLSNLKAQGSFGWLFVSQSTAVSANPQPDRCLPPGLYPGQGKSPEKQFYHIGEVVTFSCPDDFFLESRDAQRTCQENGTWSDHAPICQPKRQWWESITVVSFDQIGELLNQEFPQFARKENISVSAYFNRDFYRITEITIDFQIEFDSNEWRRNFIENDNAIFYIADSSKNILKKGPLAFREPKSLKWDSITVSAHNFVQSLCTNCSVGITFRNYHWEVPIVKAVRVFGSTFPQSNTADGNEEKQCPPIMPYHGMPEAYKSYELVAEGLINELLLTSPCREGFKFVGKRSEISQCKEGAWHGSGSPECEAIRVKSPPEVEHAKWVYVQGNGEHEVIYICESGYYATGDSKVSYSLEKDEWTGLPQCEQLRDATQQYKWPIFLVVPLVVAAFAYFTYWGLRRKEKGSGRTSNDASDRDGMLKE